ncbi:hypothetical protein BM536_000850 [Streptomyces phaeoluteigriseus]|uniref:Uncharacterized protein n=1 Tax=Streptomyces phaeoluteigriseus TaxID=114686 RepID=A0A1V6MZ35_9ACTN|nr:hypothetical protein BM536_000850 [Streptomyces phaeoluteigriseus]
MFTGLGGAQIHGRVMFTTGDGDDAGLAFACGFLPLPLQQPLADDQDSWLGRIDPCYQNSQ